MKYGIYIVPFIISIVSFAQKPMVSLSVDAKNVQIGNPITFTVKSNMEGNVEIVFPDEFIQGYGSMNGMEQEMDYNSGTVSTIYYFSQNGAFKENGTYSIYAYVKNRKAIYKSNKITIKVEKEVQSFKNDEEISQKNLKQAVFGIIQKSKSKIYEGEFVLLEAKVFSKLNINMLEAYQAFEIVGNAETKEIEKSSKLLLQRENFKGNQVLTFTYGKQLIYPSAPGKFRIKPFEMALQYTDGGIFSERIAFTSNSATIEVLPLPNGAPKNFIGGVGKFDLISKINKKEVKQGDVITYEILLTGKGNIHNTNKPKLNLPNGVTIYGDPKVEESIEFGLNGAEGEIKYIYNLQFLNAGNTNLPSFSISYFDPELKKYVTKNSDSYEIEVKPSNSKQQNLIVNQNETKINEIYSEKIPFIESRSEIENAFYNSKLFWPSLLSPLILAFASVIFFLKKNQHIKTSNKVNKNKSVANLNGLVSEAEMFFNNSNYKEALQKLELCLKSISSLFSIKQNEYFSKSELTEILKQNGVSEESISKIKASFILCEEARYTFDEVQIASNLKENIQKVKEIIKELA